MNMGWKFRRRVWVGAYVGACVRARERVRAGGRARERVRAGHLHARVRVCGECVHEMGMEVQTAGVGARARERVHGGRVCVHVSAYAASACMKWAWKFRRRMWGRARVSVCMEGAFACM